MQIDVTGKHIEITSAIHSYVVKKLQRLERHFDHVTHGHVILEMENGLSHVSATVHTNGAQLFATAHHDDMYTAADHLAHKLDRQILKHKEKLTDHSRERRIRPKD